MLLRSFDALDLPLAWRRVRTWAQGSGMDVPDALPYEILNRLYGDTGPALSREHYLHRALLIVNSKKSGTIRPFSRVHPRDLIVYQALVDALASTIEGALAPRDRVAAYRQTLGNENDAFFGSPRSDEFRAGVSQAIEVAGPVYVLQTDISGYFLGIRPGRLAEILMELAEMPEVVADLAEILEIWQERGVRGLPQGIRPSAPLANIYLASLDRRMGQMAVPFYRWADDMWAICDSFSEARRVQDEIERHLYRIGLTLNGEKTRILRAATAIQRLEPAKARFERKREEAVEEATVTVMVDEYTEAEWLPDPDEVDVGLTHEEHDRLVATLDDDDLPPEFHSDMTYVLRRLESVDDDYALQSVPNVLRRAPGLTDDAMRYVTAVGRDRSSVAVQVFAEVLRSGRFTRDHEKLAICHLALSLKQDLKTSLAQRLGEIALEDQHSLTRARALVAWGLHSADDEFGVVDQYLIAEEPEWRTYAFASMQTKQSEGRDQRYDRWGRGDTLRRVAEELREHPIEWSKL